MQAQAGMLPRKRSRQAALAQLGAERPALIEAPRATKLRVLDEAALPKIHAAGRGTHGAAQVPLAVGRVLGDNAPRREGSVRQRAGDVQAVAWSQRTKPRRVIVEQDRRSTCDLHR